jgi:hypothetical protein
MNAPDVRMGTTPSWRLLCRTLGYGVVGGLLGGLAGLLIGWLESQGDSEGNEDGILAATICGELLGLVVGMAAGTLTKKPLVRTLLWALGPALFLGTCLGCGGLIDVGHRPDPRRTPLVVFVRTVCGATAGIATGGLLGAWSRELLFWDYDDPINPELPWPTRDG